MSAGIDLHGDSPIGLEAAEIARELVGYELAIRFGDKELAAVRGARFGELAARFTAGDGIEFAASLLLALAAYAVDLAQAGSGAVGRVGGDEEAGWWTPQRLVAVAATVRREQGTAY